MKNPMLNQLRPSSNNNNNNSKNEVLQNILAQNPQINTIINQYGNGDPKTAFYEYARITGKNPDLILNMIKNLL